MSWLQPLGLHAESFHRRFPNNSLSSSCMLVTLAKKSAARRPHKSRSHKTCTSGVLYHGTGEMDIQQCSLPWIRWERWTRCFLPWVQWDGQRCSLSWTGEKDRPLCFLLWTSEKDRQQCFWDWWERPTVVFLVKKTDSGVSYCGTSEREEQQCSLLWFHWERQTTVFLTMGPVWETKSCVPYCGSGDSDWQWCSLL